MTKFRMPQTRFDMDRAYDVLTNGLSEAYEYGVLEGHWAEAGVRAIVVSVLDHCGRYNRVSLLDGLRAVWLLDRELDAFDGADEEHREVARLLAFLEEHAEMLRPRVEAAERIETYQVAPRLNAVVERIRADLSGRDPLVADDAGAGFDILEDVVDELAHLHAEMLRPRSRGNGEGTEPSGDTPAVPPVDADVADAVKDVAQKLTVAVDAVRELHAYLDRTENDLGARDLYNRIGYTRARVGEVSDLLAQTAQIVVCALDVNPETPVERASGLARRIGASVHVKCEGLVTGNYCSRCDRLVPSRDVVGPRDAVGGER